MIRLDLIHVVNIDRKLQAHARMGRDFNDEETRHRILLEVINQELIEYQEEEEPEHPYVRCLHPQQKFCTHTHCIEVRKGDKEVG